MSLLVIVAWMLNIGSWGLVYCLDFFVGSVEMELSSFLVLAAITRCAHVSFSSCLPAAMAPPTPVSALLHSSALVRLMFVD